MELMLWLSLSWEEGFLAFNIRFSRQPFPIGWVKVFCIITGTFSQNRCQKERAILLLGQTVKTEIRYFLCLYQRFPCSGQNVHTHILSGLQHLCHSGGVNFLFPVSWSFPLPSIFLLMWLQSVRTLLFQRRREVNRREREERFIAVC